MQTSYQVEAQTESFSAMTIALAQYPKDFQPPNDIFHLTRGERISSLLSLLTLATVWGVLAGELTARQAPPKIKKHGRPEKSIFRLGLETLRNCFCQMTTDFRQKQRFQQLTLLLSCT